MQTERFDVVCIGGGPAGSTAAALLAEKGHRVLVLERERFPRFHIGESLLPHNNPVFRRLGVYDELCRTALLKWGAEFVAPDGHTRRTYYFRDSLDGDEPHAFEVERAVFDELLLRNAEKKGAVVREEFEVTEVLFEGPRAVGLRARPVTRVGTGRGAKVVPAGDEREIRAQFIVDASGRDTLISGKKQWKKNDLPISKTAFFGHWTGVPRPAGVDRGNITIAAGPHGWAWLIPLHREGSRASVGVVCHKEWVRSRAEGETLDAFYERTLRQVPSVWARLEGATFAAPVQTIADISYRSERYYGPGFCLVGDAGSFLDPIFSSGVHMAMTGAASAADAIHDGLVRGVAEPRGFAEYEERVKKATEVFFKFIYAWYTPGFHDVFYTPTHKLKLLETVTSMLSGDVWDWRKRLRAELFFGAIELKEWNKKRKGGAGALPAFFHTAETPKGSARTARLPL